MKYETSARDERKLVLGYNGVPTHITTNGTSELMVDVGKDLELEGAPFACARGVGNGHVCDGLGL